MLLHNNLVQTPVKSEQLNTIISEINRGICRPITYTYYVEGITSGKLPIFPLGFIPLPCKLNPTIVYEIVSVGSLPNDDNVLMDYGTASPKMIISRNISPYAILHAVASVTPGVNNAEGYSSVSSNSEMEIATGAMLIEKPIFSPECVAAVDALTSGDPWHLEVGFDVVPPIDRASPSSGNYKQDYTIPSSMVPSFVLNVTVYYEEGIKI